MKRPAKQEAVGFALSFLDILCCGLGAAVLLLLIVRHGPADAEIDESSYLLQQLERIQSVIDRKIGVKDDLSEQIALSQQELIASAKSVEEERTTKTVRAADLQAQLAKLQNARNRLSDSAADLRSLQAEREALVDAADDGEAAYPNQLAGLSILPERVLILMDRSASMLDPSIVEIVRLRASPVRTQQLAEKWNATRNTAKWVFSRLPDAGSFQFMRFSDSVLDVSGKAVPSSGTVAWLNKGKSGITRTQMSKVIDDTTASGATNLKDALAVAKRLVPKPQQIVLITDGLPTLPGNTRLGSLRGCPGQRQGVTPIISPRCRMSIFRDAVKALDGSARDVRVDVILLPLDGDARAVREYWHMAAVRNGRLLTPAKGWPFR